MMWKRRSIDGIQQLPEERRVLAERYTIDADEAQRREQLAAEAAAREAEEQARREARAELERKAAEEEARRAAAEEARRAAEAEERARRAAARVADPEPRPVLVSLPDPPESSTAPAVGSREAEDYSGGTETAREEDEPAASSELPIYRWFGDS